MPALALARRTGVPLHYLAKVLQQLSAAELIAGRRGLGGGYTLKKPPGQIRLTDVVRATESVRRIERCPMGEAEHNGVLCSLHRAMDGIAACLVAELDRYTVSDILAQPGENVPLCKPNPVRVTMAEARPIV